MADFGTKAAIKAAYLTGLVERYDWARGDGPGAAAGLALAERAAGDALAGTTKLKGGAWYAALAANGVQKGATRAQIAALPPGGE